MQYKIINGSVSYDSDTILENIDIEINEGEKIAVVGRNGCGKTTLLKAIMGEVEMEEGTGESAFRVLRVGEPSIDYLKQTPFADERVRMRDEVLRVFAPLTEMEERLSELISKMERTHDESVIAAFTSLNDRYIASGGMTYRKECDSMIRHFGFSQADSEKPLSEFSGGQRTKIAFIKMLLSKPDILLLDEPTNHLDIETVWWLEEYLRSYTSTLVIVSHDRMFLDHIVNKVYEIEWGETRCYKGNYTDFEKQKKERYLKQQKDHIAQKQEIERIKKLIERFRYKATKAKMVQSKIKMLEKMELIDAPDRYDTKTFRASFQPEYPSSRIVLQVPKLTVGYTSPLATVSFQLEKGQKLGIIGGNGVGKSTLLKTLIGAIPPLSGNFAFGYNANIAYFDQQLAQLRTEETVYDVFAKQFPALTDTQVRTALGSFQFSGEDVFHPVSSLSGGEKVRLTLCTILYRRPNVLLLDEPTNHMDIIGKETLESILEQYEGTVLFVSHDRYFVQKIATRLMIFEDGNVRFFDGKYEEFEEKRRALLSETPSASNVPAVKEQKKKTKFTTPLKEQEKRRKRIEKLELLMQQAEDKIRTLEEQLLSPEVYSDYQKVEEIQAEIDTLRASLPAYEDEWTALMEEE